MKYYIASKYSSRHRIKLENAKLADAGFENTCPWFIWDADDTADSDSLGGLSREEHERLAVRDLEAISEVDLFIIDTHDTSATGGREVELGCALALDKLVWRVGPIRNVFHMHPDIVEMPSWPAVIASAILKFRRP